MAAVAMFATPAFAADMPVKARPAPAPAPPPPWDIAFGGAVMSDYNFRGVSQSNRGPSGTAYYESQFTSAIGTLYTGTAAWAIDWPNAYGFSSPSAEIDFYGGWRNTWGPLTLDIGFIYYYYPKELFGIQSDFWEVYGKVAYAITKDLTVGVNVYYTPDLLNYGAVLTDDVRGVYASLTGKWVLPWTSGPFGAFLSGEIGHWWLKEAPFVNAGLADASYTYYNAGIGFTYKAITLDLRWHGTDQNQQDCANFLLVGVVANPASKWCKDTFIASVKFDTSINALK
jgi:uncharacterized protein (TIGR02001 family)